MRNDWPRMSTVVLRSAAASGSVRPMTRRLRKVRMTASMTRRTLDVKRCTGRLPVSKLRRLFDGNAFLHANAGGLGGELAGVAGAHEHRGEHQGEEGDDHEGAGFGRAGDH